MPRACSSVREKPADRTSRMLSPAVTARMSAAGLQPTSPPLFAILCALLPSPDASQTAYSDAEGLLARNASHRPSGENAGSSGAIPGVATWCSAPVLPSSTHRWPRDTNASSPWPTKAAALTAGLGPGWRLAEARDVGWDEDAGVEPQPAATITATAVRPIVKRDERQNGPAFLHRMARDLP